MKSTPNIFTKNSDANMLGRFTIFFVILSLSSCAKRHVKIDHENPIHTERRFNVAIDFKKTNYPLLVDAIHHATNEARKEHGLSALRKNTTLMKAARRYAKRQAKGHFLAHIDPSGGPKTPDDRARVFGGKNPHVSENLAITAGYPIESGEPIYIASDGSYTRKVGGEKIPPHTYRSFARDVVEQWLNSPGHRKNLLDSQALELGCGVYILYQGQIPSFVSVQNFQVFEKLRS